jgi:hypothetical protein
MRITSNLNIRVTSPFSASLSEDVFLEYLCGTHSDSPTSEIREIQNHERLRGQSPEARGSCRRSYERYGSIEAKNGFTKDALPYQRHRARRARERRVAPLTSISER